MLRIDYLLNKMIETVEVATLELEGFGIENGSDLLKKK